MKDTVLIYRDDNIKIEVNKKFHLLLKEIGFESFILNDSELDLVLYITLSMLKELGFKVQNPVLIKNVLILKPNNNTTIEKPITNFNKAISYIESYMTLDDELNPNITEQINEKINGEGVFCYIFPRKIFDVKGFLLYSPEEENEDVYLMFFGFKERTIDFNF